MYTPCDAMDAVTCAATATPSTTQRYDSFRELDARSRFTFDAGAAVGEEIDISARSWLCCFDGNDLDSFWAIFRLLGEEVGELSLLGEVGEAHEDQAVLPGHVLEMVRAPRRHEHEIVSAQLHHV